MLLGIAKSLVPGARNLLQVTIYRRLWIGRDGHLDQSEAYDISQRVRQCGPWVVSVTFKPDCGTSGCDVYDLRRFHCVCAML